MTGSTQDTSTDSDSNPLSQLTYVSGTDIGMKREENQDSHGVILTEHFHYYLVADGMGGVKGGATASRLAIETFEKVVRKAGGVGVKIVRDGVWEANYNVFKTGKQDPALTGMGTTFVGLGFEGEKLYTINVGDSRAYRIRQGTIKQLTEDHTLVQELVKSGALASEHAENHPVSHMLTRSLGPAESVEPDCRLIQDGPARGDRYLLCSDGLYNLVTDQEICEIVSSKSLDDAIQECIRLANERGGTDNITVTIVEVGERYPKTVEDFPEIDDTQTIELDAEEAIQLEQELQKEREEEEQEEEGTPVISSGISIENMSGAFQKPPEPRGEEVTSQQSPPSPEEPQVEGTSRISDAYRTKKIEIDPILQPPSAPSSVPLKLVLGVGIPFVIIVAFFAFSSGKQQSQNQSVAKLEQVPPEPPKTTYEVKSEPAPVENKQESENTNASVEAVSNATRSEEPVAVTEQKVRDEESSVLERATYLKNKIERLEKQLYALSSPLNASILQNNDVGDAELEGLNRQRDDIRKKIDIATRRLAVWYGRRKRLDQSDPVSLATEVAVSSQKVKEAKETFERTTWQYLKASEELRYDPANADKKEEVSRLTKERKRYYRELLDSVRSAIDLEIAESDRQIAELTLQRESINEKVNDVRREKEHMRIVLRGTPEEKQSQERELREELALLRSELEVLRSHMSPSLLYEFNERQADTHRVDTESQGGDESLPENDAVR